MRIGIAFEYVTRNGGEHSILAAMVALQPRGYEFVVLAPGNGPLLETVAQLAIPVENFTMRTASGGRVDPEETVHALNSLAAKHRLNLLHANSLTMGRRLGALAPQLAIPTTCHVRDIMSLKKGEIHDLNQLQALFAVSNATRDYHIQQGIHPVRIQRIYNGINCDRFQPRIATGWLRTELKIPESCLLAATIGQICLRKSQSDLAEAAVLLKETVPHLHYLVVGQRHSTKQESLAFERRMDDTVRDAGIEHRWHRLGFREEIPALLNEIDLLIHSARQEPLGRVLLEAAACGIPIVATNVGGTLEILENETSALIVPAAEPERLASAVQQLAMSSDLRKRLGGNARRTILERFDVTRVVDDLATAWELAAK